MNTVLNQTDAASDHTTPAQNTVVKKTVAKKAIAQKTPVKKIAAKKSPAKNATAVKPASQKNKPVQFKTISDKSESTTQKVKVKVKKQKMIRDSFTMPEVEYQILEDLKKTCLKQGIAIKKSELLRIGVATLKTMTSKQIQIACNKLEKISAGRPKKN